MYDIDWSIFDQYSEDTCFCKCGTIYRSHTKMTNKLKLISRKQCPNCNKSEDNLIRVSSEPEIFEIK